MTQPAPLLPPTRTRSTLWDRIRTGTVADPVWGPMLRWLVPLAVTTLAAVLRLIGLNHPHELAFDETYYVKDAWSLWTLGYEGEWGDDANQRFPTGDTGSLSTKASFIVHPPLGKWIIGIGMMLFGPASSGGWRLTTALLGAGTVLVVYGLAMLLTRSMAVATIASLLLAIDGLGIVMSRIALLDGILTFFIALGFLFAVLDRRRSLPLIAARDHEAPDPFWGRVLWRRPWLLAAGATLGAATAVKWSGLYALAAIGIYVVVTDALARRRAGVVFWPTDAVLRQGPISFLLLVPVALVAYLVTWTGWLVTDGGYDRSSDPNPLIALWNFHKAIYGFHVGLTSGHPYASPAYQWPLLLRPTAVWVGGGDQDCWGSDHCMAAISTVPNPLIWYAGVAASGYLLYRLVRGLVLRQPMPWSYGVPLVGLAATYVPWLLFPQRTIFQFYTIAMMPFLVLALALALRDLAGRRRDPLHRRQSGQRTVIVFLVVAVLISAFYYPVWTGMSVPYPFWLAHAWLPGWI